MKLPFFIAKRFVAGETLDRALPKVEQINDKGIAVALDFLGENVTKPWKADQITEEYVNILKHLSDAGLKASISVKATMLGLTIGHDHCRDNLFTLLDTAREEGRFVSIDMEGSDHTQATINLFKEAFETYGHHVGIAIQAYLHRTTKDIPELAEMGADVRLVKGAYNEPESLALQKMADIRGAYREYAKILLDKTDYPRFGTHDGNLINWIKEYTESEEIGKEDFEFQMLYGLRQRTMEKMARDDYQTRIYVPFGTDWFPYFSRRLTERKENIWFVTKYLFQQ